MYNAKAAKATRHSVSGKESHTPVISNKADIRNAIGRMTANPLDREISCAGRGFSIAAK